MKRRFGPVLLIVFAWLQCLAPLMHAHAAGEGHAGVHLPEWSAAGPDHDGHCPAVAHQAHTQEAIGVASSLQGRQDGMPVQPPGLVARLAAAEVHAIRAGPVARATDRILPPTPHRLPEACAPPRA